MRALFLVLSMLVAALPAVAEELQPRGYRELSVAPLQRPLRARAPVGMPRPAWRVQLPFRRPAPPLPMPDGSLLVAGEGGLAAYSATGSALWHRALAPIRNTPLITPSGDALALTEAGDLLRVPTSEPVVPRRLARSVRGSLLLVDGGTLLSWTQPGSLDTRDVDGGLLDRFEIGLRGAPRVISLGGTQLAVAGDDAWLGLMDLDTGLTHKLGLPERAVAGPVAAADGFLWLVGEQGSLMAVGRDGRLTVRVRLAGAGRASTPVLGRDGLLRVAAGRHSIHCLGPDGASRWSQRLDGRPGPLLLDAQDATVVTTTRGSVYVINADGRVRYRFASRAKSAPRPVLADDGTLYVATRGGLLQAWR